MKRVGELLVLVAVFVAVFLVAPGCTFVSKATDFNGVPGQEGRPVEFISATKVGLHFLYILPLLGDISTASTIDALTEQAKEDGLTNLRIVQTSTSVMWYVLIPVSFFIHPVITTVSADAELKPLPEGATVGEEADEAAGERAGEEDGEGAQDEGDGE